MSKIPNQLSTQRLLLRSYRPDDASIYFQTVQANRTHLHDFLPPQLLTMQSQADADQWIRHLMAEWEMRRLFLFGVWTKDSGAFVGETYLANPDWQVPCIELGYFLSQDHTGKGFATEAARCVIQFAFEHLLVFRIELQCAADNPGSIRVAERCRFQPEGRLRQRHLKKDGTRVDRLWFGLLLSDWQAVSSTK